MDQQQFLQKFNEVSTGSSKYITLDVLQLGIPYEVTRFRTFESTYGRCLAVDLTVGFWLVLPKRIGDLVSTEEQLNWLNSQHFWMIFKGRNEKYRKMAVIEFKTMEQYVTEQAVAAINEPVINFSVDNIQSGTTAEVEVHAEDAQLVDFSKIAEELMREETKEKVVSKTGAAPKVSIKVKKERR